MHGCAKIRILSSSDENNILRMNVADESPCNFLFTRATCGSRVYVSAPFCVIIFCQCREFDGSGLV